VGGGVKSHSKGREIVRYTRGDVLGWVRDALGANNSNARDILTNEEGSKPVWVGGVRVSIRGCPHIN
jgi:hypothetical protein